MPHPVDEISSRSSAYRTLKLQHKC